MGDRRRKKSSNFIIQGGILAIAGIIVRIIGMFYRIPVTNIIGDVGNGYYAVAFQVYNTMLIISSYSLPVAVSKLIAPRVSRGQFKNAKKIFRCALAFAIFSGTVSCLLVFFGADFIAGTLMTEPMSSIALKVVAPTLLIVAVLGVIRGYFQGMGTMMPTAVSQIIEQVVNAIVSIVAAAFLFSYGGKVGALLRNASWAPAYGAAGSTLGTGTGALFAFLFLIFVLSAFQPVFRRQLRRDSSKKEESYYQIFCLLMITITPVILSATIYNISDTIDNGLFNYIMTMKGQGDIQTAYWGIYSGKYKVLTHVPVALASAMVSSIMPGLTADVSEGNLKKARYNVGLVTRFTMIVTIPCAVGLGVLALPIMNLLYGADQSFGARLMQIGAVSVVLYSLSTLSNGVLQGINKMKIPIKNACIALALHFAALYVMLYKLEWNIYAVVYANILFALIMCILNALSIRKHLKYTQEVKKTFIIPIASATVMGAIVLLIYFIFQLTNVTATRSGNVMATLISVVVGAVIYFVMLLLLKGVKEGEILKMPMGKFAVRIAKMFRLL